jgi:glutathione reductase (NADPH)
MKHILSANEQRMVMKLVVRRRDDVVVGVHIAGPDAPEMVQLAAIAVKAGLTKAQWDATCALHPTAAEELVTLREKAA